MRRILQANYTSKFCIIPSEIIEDLGLSPGDKLDFSIEGDHIKVTPVYPSAKMNIQAPATNAHTKGADDANDRIHTEI